MDRIIINENIAIIRNEGMNEEEATALMRGILVLKKFSNVFEQGLPKEKRIWRVLESSNITGELIKRAAEKVEKRVGALEGVINGYCFRNINEVHPEVLRKIFDSINEITAIDSEKNILEINNILNDFVRRNTRSDMSTVKSVNKLIADLIDVKEGENLLDFYASEGELFLGIIDQMKEKYSGKIENRFTACEFDKRMFWNMKLNIFFKETENIDVFRMDMFKELPEEQNGKVRKFDNIVSSAILLDRAKQYEFKNDKYGRYSYGIPSKANIEWAIIQTALYCLNECGRAALILTRGTFFRTTEKDMKKNVIQRDFIEAVISMPPGVIYGSSIPVEILLINKKKDETRKDKILFIDATKEIEKDSRKHYILSDSQREKILKTIIEGKELGGYSRFVNLETIKENDYNLNSKIYTEHEELKGKIHDSIELSSLAKVIRGVTISKGDMEKLKDPEGYYYLNVKDIVDGRLDYDTCERINFKKDTWEGKYTLKEDDIVITCKGSAFKAVLAREDFRESIISSNLMIIRVDKEKYDPVVVLKYLNSELGKKRLEGVFSGSVQKVITPKNLKMLSIPNYDREKLKELSELIWENEKTYEKAIKRAQQIYDEKNKKLKEMMGI